MLTTSGFFLLSHAILRLYKSRQSIIRETRKKRSQVTVSYVWDSPGIEIELRYALLTAFVCLIFIRTLPSNALAIVNCLQKRPENGMESVNLLFLRFAIILGNLTLQGQFGLNWFTKIETPSEKRNSSRPKTVSLHESEHGEDQRKNLNNFRFIILSLFQNLRKSSRMGVISFSMLSALEFLQVEYVALLRHGFIIWSGVILIFFRRVWANYLPFWDGRVHSGIPDSICCFSSL